MDNYGLVEYAKRWLNFVTRYGWGCFGQAITDNIIRQKSSQYPSHYDADRQADLRDLIGKGFLIDCIGLIKGYLWGQTPGSGVVGYDGNSDVDADTMYRLASEKGAIWTIPELPGVAVYMPGHIGVYIGNGQTIESTRNESIGDGVVQRSLSGRSWTHWLKIPFIEYKEVVVMDNEPSSWAKESVDWAVANEMLFGDANGNLKLREPVTREQMMVFIKRLYDKIKGGM